MRFHTTHATSIFNTSAAFYIEINRNFNVSQFNYDKLQEDKKHHKTKSL